MPNSTTVTGTPSSPSATAESGRVDPSIHPLQTQPPLEFFGPGADFTMISRSHISNGLTNQKSSSCTNLVGSVPPRVDHTWSLRPRFCANQPTVIRITPVAKDEVKLINISPHDSSSANARLTNHPSLSELTVRSSTLKATFPTRQPRAQNKPRVFLAPSIAFPVDTLGNLAAEHTATFHEQESSSWDDALLVTSPLALSPCAIACPPSPLPLATYNPPECTTFLLSEFLAALPHHDSFRDYRWACTPYVPQGLPFQIMVIGTENWHAHDFAHAHRILGISGVPLFGRVPDKDSFSSPSEINLAQALAALESQPDEGNLSASPINSITDAATRWTGLHRINWTKLRAQIYIEVPGDLSIEGQLVHIKTLWAARVEKYLQARQWREIDRVVSNIVRIEAENTSRRHSLSDQSQTSSDIPKAASKPSLFKRLAKKFSSTSISSKEICDKDQGITWQ